MDAVGSTPADGENETEVIDEDEVTHDTMTDDAKTMAHSNNGRDSLQLGNAGAGTREAACNDSAW